MPDAKDFRELTRPDAISAIPRRKSRNSYFNDNTSASDIFRACARVFGETTIGPCRNNFMSARRASMTSRLTFRLFASTSMPSRFAFT
jgi:hypothetical protein